VLLSPAKPPQVAEFEVILVIVLVEIVGGPAGAGSLFLQEKIKVLAAIARLHRVVLIEFISVSLIY